MSWIGPSQSIEAADSTAVRVICVGSVTGGAGTTASVPVVVDDGLDVASFQIDVQYDPSLVTPLPARLGAATQVAGGWTVDSQIIAAGLLRVLAYSTPPVGLGSGFKQIALLDFLIGSGGAAGDNPIPLLSCILGDPNAASLACSLCIQPGVLAAEPRFVISLVDDAIGFRSSHQFVEQGDWVLWRNVGASQSHTTTSGTSCSPDSLWNGVLSPGEQFARQFAEPPGAFPYFCQPHCQLGEVGTVTVVLPIQLSASESLETLSLTWVGGSGVYRVFRSASPAFVGGSTASFPPDAGGDGRSFTDTTQPGPGGALFYLVTNPS